MTPAQERRLLQRKADPLTVAAFKIFKLKHSLFAALDKGGDSATRASGESKCPVCGDPFWCHPQPDDSCPTIVGICTGERFKL